MYLHPYDYETMYVYVHFCMVGLPSLVDFPHFFGCYRSSRSSHPLAVLQQPFCFKVPKNDSKKIDSPPKKKTTIFRLSDPKNTYFPPERPPSSPLRTMHGTSDSRLQRPGAGCVWQGDGVSQKKLQKSSMVKFLTILRWFWFQTLNFNWILISTISWCCFKPLLNLVRLDFIKFWAVDS